MQHLLCIQSNLKVDYLLRGAATAATASRKHSTASSIGGTRTKITLTKCYWNLEKFPQRFKD